MHCNAMRCDAMQYNAMQYNKILQESQIQLYNTYFIHQILKLQLKRKQGYNNSFIIRTSKHWYIPATGIYYCYTLLCIVLGNFIILCTNVISLLSFLQI